MRGFAIARFPGAVQFSMLLASLTVPSIGDETAEPPEPVWPPAHWFDPLATVPRAASGERAMIASANPWATEAGLEILRRGGGAVDAAIAAQFVLNVVEPQSSGIGGGCFLLYVPRSAGDAVVIDGRETAPAAAGEDLLLDALAEPVPYYPERVTGGRVAGVPGTLAALWLAHERYGRLTWGELLDPAIGLARDGFLVSRRLHDSIAAEAPRLLPFEGSRALFFHADSTPLDIGERLRQPDLAATLERIAREGPRVFYEGEIGADIVAAVVGAAQSPGRLAAADLARYRAVARMPVRGTYRGYEVLGVGPPSSGGLTTIEILNILEGYDLGSMAAGSPEAVHLILEAGKLAFADRNRYIGDGDFVPVPVETLLAKSFAATRRSEIDPRRALPAPMPPAMIASDPGHTTHLSVLDAEGNAVALTSTIEQSFGSGIVVPGRGFLLNNELSDFDAVPRYEDGVPAANRVQPGKRPRSSMSPTVLVQDGVPVLAIGSPGGSRIIGITVNVILGVVDWRMDIQEAINFPRAYNRGLPFSDLEDLYFDDLMLRHRHGVFGTVDRLHALGHLIARPGRPERAVGGAHGVMLAPDGRTRLGGADPRLEGVALGF